MQGLERLLSKVITDYWVLLALRPLTRNSSLQLNPDIDIDKELEAGLSDQESGTSTSLPTQAQPADPSKSNTLRPPMAAGPSTSAVSDSLDPSDDESEVQKNVVEDFNRLSINPMTYRYHGKSSGLVFLRAAQHLKGQVEADASDSAPAPAPEQPAMDIKRLVRKQLATSPVSWPPLSLH